jgi:ABC-type Na+ transport system ATPase subunit NatA
MVAEVEKALSGLGFDKADFGHRLAELSGGQKNRAMLARAILSSPDVLLLDEPTNHLDFQAVEFLRNTWRAPAARTSSSRTTGGFSTAWRARSSTSRTAASRPTRAGTARTGGRRRSAS